MKGDGSGSDCGSDVVIVVVCIVMVVAFINPFVLCKWSQTTPSPGEVVTRSVKT